MSEHPKVFVSYSHQNQEYENKILELTNHLRAEGIDANVDLYEESPEEGWPRWMENQINNSDFVLVVNSKSYFEKCYSKSGKGISWEVNIIYQHIYDMSAINTKFIPIYFDESDKQYILPPLKSFTFYNVGEKEGFDKLYWRLRGFTKTEKPPLGKLRPLPQKEKKSIFFSTPINLDEWNAAEWRGALYLFNPGHIPVLGLIYLNYTSAKKIFSTWKKIAKHDFADDFIKIDFITPPFPKDCWVYDDKYRNYGKGYFIHIGPNIEKAKKQVSVAGFHQNDCLITFSRFQWMDELSGSKNRNLFQQLTKDGEGYFLIPIGIKDKNKPIEKSNLIIDFNYAIRMKNVTFRNGIKIGNDDMLQVVLQNPNENM